MPIPFLYLLRLRIKMSLLVGGEIIDINFFHNEICLFLNISFSANPAFSIVLPGKAFVFLEILVLLILPLSPFGTGQIINKVGEDYNCAIVL